MQKSKIFASLAIAALCLGGCEAASYGDDAKLYHGFTQIDPDQETLTPNAWLVVSDSKIQKTGSGALPKGAFAETHDMQGHYAMPGLIDAHAHIVSGPHKVEIRDGAPAVTIESVDAITEYHARNALAFGFTTVRNPGGDPEASAEYDQKINSGEWIGPEAVHAGAVIQPPPFVGNAFAYPTTDEEWDAEAARQAALGMTYFKLYVDLSEEELARGIKAAHDHGLQAIVHLNKVSWTRAAELGIDGIEHALPTSPDLLEPDVRQIYLDSLGPDSKFMYRWFELADLDGPLIKEMISLLAEKQVQTNMTLLVNDLVYNIDDLDRIWPQEARQYVHPEALAGMLSFLQAGSFGWTPEDFDRARAVMPKVLQFAKLLYDSGVPMMIGTDGNGGGPQFAREMAMHIKAGIPVWAVMRMATSDTADLIGIGDRTGTLSEGKEADIVFLKENPLADISNISHVAYVMSNGEFYAFDALAQTAP